ncbi:hypothetical protein F5Y03DRAFT_68592 [Xylaria venustula]|nr:hypothetical protein F5Y03DRAFT_68592 [Xylaria venustula]
MSTSRVLCITVILIGLPYSLPNRLCMCNLRDICQWSIESHQRKGRTAFLGFSGLNMATRVRIRCVRFGVNILECIDGIANITISW